MGEPVVDSGSLTVSEDSLDAALGLTAPTDADNDVLTITVASLPDPTKGVVTLADGTAVTVGQELTEAELLGLQYDTVADANGPAGSFVYSVSDGSTTVDGTVDFNITPVNDAPELFGISGDAVGYTSLDGAVAIEQGGDALVSDLDSPDFAGGELTVSITSGGDAAEDVLSVLNQGVGAGEIGFDGSNVTYGGVLIGTVSGGSGGAPLVVTLNGSADSAAVTALVGAISYENTDTVSPTAGPRVVDFTLSDGDGGVSDTSSATVAVSALLSQTLEVRIAAASDDAEERVSNGSMSVNSSDLELVTESSQQIVGMRFVGIEIPVGAVITNAYLQFQVDETDTIATSLLIQGEAALDPLTFTFANSNISSRPMTAASVVWEPPAWTTVGQAGPDQQTPDLSAVIQEIIDQEGWTSGNAVVLLVTGTGKRTAESFNGVQSAAPLLHVEYALVEEPVNSPPTVNLTPVVTSLAGDTDTSVAITVADIVVIDDGLGTNTFTLSGDDAALFEIVGTELRLKAGVVLDPVGNPTLDVTVEVDDAAVGASPDSSAPYSVTIQNVNEAPSVSLTPVVTNLLESADTSTAIKVADIVVTDDALGTNTLSLSGDDAGLFEIVGTELRLKAGAVLDFETNPTLDVTVEVDDAAVGASPDSSAPYSVTVQDVNEAPSVSLTPVVTNLPEDADTSTAIKVADIVVTDDALGTNTLSLSGDDAGLFEIVGTELRLKAGTVLDPVGNPTLDVTVEVDDAAVGVSPDSTAPYAVTVTEVNDPPSVSLTPVVTNLLEDADTSTAIKVADIVVTDDALGTNTLSLSGADAGLFEIVGTELRLKAGAVLDFETNPSLDVTLEVDDAAVGASPDSSAPYSVTVQDVNEAPSVSLTPVVTNLLENADTSTAIKVADIVVTDDALGTNTLSLSGDDAGLFEIVGTELRLKAGAVLDFETNPSLDVTVEVDDAAVGASPDSTAPYSVTVQDANETPSVSLTPVVTNLLESADTSSAIKVADIVVTDDALGTNTLSLSGDDAGLFAIVGTELRLKAGAVLDFETNPSLDVTVEVDDAAVGVSPDSSAPYSVTIQDVNEAPSVSLTPVVTNLLESADTSTAIKVADIVITDDALGTNTLSLSGDDAALFEIVGMELRLKAGAVLDFETNPSLDVTVEVDDAAVGASPDSTSPYAVTVQDVNEAPAVSLTPVVTNLPEDADTSSAIKVADIVVTDDALGTNTLSLSGDDAALFEIVGTDLRLKAGVALDSIGNPTLDVTVEVDDTAVGVTPDDIAVLSLIIDPPANVPPTILNLAGDSVSLMVGAGASAIEQGGDAVVQDANSVDFDGGQLSVSVSSGGVAAEDLLSIADQGSGAGQIGFDGSNVTYGGTLIGTVAGGSGGAPLVVTLNAAADAAAATALVRAITYENSDTVSPTAGPRTVDFTLSDGDGGTSAVFSTTVTVGILLSQTLDVRISATSDDAEEHLNTGSISLGSSDLELITESSEQIVGMRFNGIEIPVGAIITKAYIQFQVDETSSIATSLMIHGEATLDALTFTTATGSISARPMTTASVGWLPAAWNTVGEAGPDQQTPDISAVIQEIIDQPGWAAGSSLAILITGSGKRTAESFDGVQAAAPLLHIEFGTITQGEPAIDLDADNSSGALFNDFATAYQIAGPPVSIADTDVLITDSSGGAQLVSAHITLTNPMLGDELVFNGLPPAGITAQQISLTEWTLQGNASFGDYATAIKSITFENTDVGDIGGDRTIEVVVSDGAHDSAVATSTVSVGYPPVINFWTIADTPYSSSAATALANYMSSVPDGIEFVTHLGDIKSGSGSFSIDVYQNVADILHLSSVPVFIIPGDNEWNDTSDPDLAWANWEATFMQFDQGWTHDLPVVYQAVRPENYAFVANGVLFIGINFVGGAVHDAAEWLQRGADDLAWIETNFQLFGDQVTSAVISGHANPGRSGYGNFESGFIAAAQSFADPILWLQGDSHTWNLSKPYAEAPNITKVIVDQTNDAHAPLLVSVSTDPDNPFTFDHDFGVIA